jgi:hypothetical protein
VSPKKPHGVPIGSDWFDFRRYYPADVLNSPEIAEIRAADAKLNANRTLTFAINSRGDVLRIRFLSWRRSDAHPSGRRMMVDCDLPDEPERVSDVKDRLRQAAVELRERGQLTNDDLRQWLADVLFSMYMAIEEDRPNMWDARLAFGLNAAKGRRSTTGRRDLYLALDVGLTHAGGITIEKSMDLVNQTWGLAGAGDEIIRKAWKDWGKVAKRIVDLFLSEDQSVGIPREQSIADFRDALHSFHLWRAPGRQLPLRQGN